MKTYYTVRHALQLLCFGALSISTNAQSTCDPGLPNVYFKVQFDTGLSFNDYYTGAPSFETEVAARAGVTATQVYFEEFETTSMNMNQVGDSNTFVHVRVCTAEQDTGGATAVIDAQRATILNNLNTDPNINSPYAGYATVPAQGIESNGETFSIQTGSTSYDSPVYEMSIRLETIPSSTFDTSNNLEQDKLKFALLQLLSVDLAIPDVLFSDIQIGGINEEMINSVVVSEIHYLLKPTEVAASTQASEYETRMNAMTDSEMGNHGVTLASSIGLDVATNAAIAPVFHLMPLHDPTSSDGNMCDMYMPHVQFQVKMGLAVSFNEYLALREDFSTAFQNAVTSLPDGLEFTLGSIDTGGALSADAETLFYVTYRVCLNAAEGMDDDDIYLLRLNIKTAVENVNIPMADVAGATEDMYVSSVTLVGEDLSAATTTDPRSFYTSEFKIQDVSVLPLDNPVPLTMLKFKILDILAAELIPNVLPADVIVNQPYDISTAGDTVPNTGIVPIVIYRDESTTDQTTAFNDLFTAWDATKQSDAGISVATALGVFSGMDAATQASAEITHAPTVHFYSDGTTTTTPGTTTDTAVVCDRLQQNVYFQVKIGASNTAVSSFDSAHKVVTAKIAELSTIPLANFVIDGITTTATSLTDDQTSPLVVAYRACLFLPDSADAATISDTRLDFKNNIQNAFPMNPSTLNLYTFSAEELTLLEDPVMTGEGVIPATDARPSYQAKYVMENTGLASLTAWRLIKLRLSILDTLSHGPFNVPDLFYSDIKIHTPEEIPNAYVTISSVYVSIFHNEDDPATAPSAQTTAMQSAIADWTMDTQAAWGETYAGALGFFKSADGVTDLSAEEIEDIKTNTRPVFILGQSGIDAALVSYSASTGSSLSTAQGISDEMLAEPTTTVFDTGVAAFVHLMHAEPCDSSSLLCVHFSFDGKVAAQSYVLQSVQCRTKVVVPEHASSTSMSATSAVLNPANVGDTTIASRVINADNTTVWTFQVPMGYTSPPTDGSTMIPKLDLTLTLIKQDEVNAAVAEPLVIKATASLLSASSATSMVSGVSYDGTVSVKYKSMLLNGKELALYLNIGSYGSTDGFYPVGVNGAFAALNNDGI